MHNRIIGGLCLLVWVILCVGMSCCSALTLTGSLIAEPSVSVMNPCSVHQGYQCRSTASDARVLNAGFNPCFSNAFYTKMTGEWDPTGWTLNFAADPLDAVLNISTYRAYNHFPHESASNAGAEIRIDWMPAEGQSDMKWVQALYTNRPRYAGKEYYMDILRTSPNQPPLYPYAYTDFHFYDKPGRACDTGGLVFWNAYLYLARIDRSSKVLTVYEGVEWGFTVDCVVIPELSSIAVLASCCGGFAFIGLFKRRVA